MYKLFIYTTAVILNAGLILCFNVIGFIAAMFVFSLANKMTQSTI